MSEENVAPSDPPKQRFVDRLWGLRAVLAVAVASVIIGGLGGAAIAKAGDQHGGDQFGPGRGGFRGFQGGQGGPGRGQGFGGQRSFGQQNGQQNGQQQPPTAPSPTPSASPSAGQTS